MSSFSRHVYSSQPLSPALRNEAQNSFGIIKPFPALGTDWSLRLTARIDPGQWGYLVSVVGRADLNPNVGIIVGFTAADLVEYFCFENPGGVPSIVSRLPFPIGHKNRENTYEIVSSSTSGVTIYLNGESVGHHPRTPNVIWGEEGLFLGSFRGYSYEQYGHLYVRGRYDDLRVEIGSSVIVDVNFNDGTGFDSSGSGHSVQLRDGAFIYPNPAPSASNTYTDTYKELY